MAEAPPEHPLVELLGAEVAGKEGPVATESLSEVELLGIYFSAHWCPPCKAFTPRLVECYNAVNANGKRFEIIFASSDQDQAQYDEYYGEMPWLTVGFQSVINDKLSAKYKVQGIPTLVFVDPNTGRTVTKDGRDAVMADLEGAEFPWTPKSFWETMGESEVIGKDEGATISAQELKEQLAGGYLGIYFSAHWCGPCRGFTPQLSQWYEEKKDGFGVPFEIIFASSDRDETAFNGYYGEMPWRAIPFSNRALKEKLSSMFKVRGIPTFGIVSADTGKIVTLTGRAGVMSDPDGFPWPKKAAGVLGGAQLSEINSTPFLLIFSEDDGKEQVNLLLPHAQEIEAKSDATGEDFEMFLCTVPKEMDLRGRLRAVMNLEEGGSKLVVLSIPDGSYYASDITDGNAIDQAAVDDFLAAYRSGGVEKRALEPPK